VPGDTDAPRGHRDADPRASDGAEAEEGVEQRHERLAERLLDGGRLDVHHDVGGSEAQPRKARPVTAIGYAPSASTASAAIRARPIPR
jgi:hypothetical protein